MFTDASVPVKTFPLCPVCHLSSTSSRTPVPRALISLPVCTSALEAQLPALRPALTVALILPVLFFDPCLTLPDFSRPA